MKITIKGAEGLASRERYGRTIVYWRASRPMINAGYRPIEVEIKGFNPHDPNDYALIANEWRKLQQQAELWMRGKPDPTTGNGTVRDLSRAYQTGKASPFQRVRPTTQRLYDHELRLIEKICGERIVANITADDVVDLYNEARGEDHIRRAQGFIKRIRDICKFGKITNFPGARDLYEILSAMRFETPARRTSVLTFDMATSIIAKAHKLGTPSIALAQAIQFETGLRQTDVIGQWTGKGEDARWHSGLVWQQIGTDGVLSLSTSKTGATVTHDILKMPLVKAEIDRIEKDRRIGPLIIDERSGRPYLHTEFSKQWRKVANAAGVPSTVWNRDSRAGALSEGDEAGATLNDLQRTAGHTTAKTTARYIRGDAVETSRKVTELRVAKRSKNTT